MQTIHLIDYTGNFAENKDVAKRLRLEVLLPALASGQAVTFDFTGVGGATQSFIHALISDAIRKYPDTFFDNVFYKNASPEAQEIISIVYRYMQESM